MIINASNRFQSDLALYNVVVPSSHSVGEVASSSSRKSITIRATVPGRYYAVIQKSRVLYFTISGRTSISSISNATISTLNYDKQNIAPENHTFSVTVPKYSGNSGGSGGSYYYRYYIFITVWGPDKVTFIE